MEWREIAALLGRDSFVRESLWFVVLLTPMSAVMGVLISVRRAAGVSGALSHALVLGVGLSFFWRSRGELLWLTPFVGALVVALLFMLLLGWLGDRVNTRRDVHFNLIWAAGMSGGLLLVKLTPGYVDLLSYLFGDLLLLRPSDLWLLLALNCAVLSMLLLHGRALRLSSFDRDFAVSRGMKVFAQELTFNVLICLTIVALSTTVGQLMVLAMLTIPAAAALLFARTLVWAFVFAGAFVFVAASAGLLLSLRANLPTSSVMILLMVVLYLSLLPLRRRGHG